MEEIIIEIAELIDMAEVVYLHRETHEILSHPDPKDSGYTDELDYLMQEVLDVVDMDPDSYIKFEPLDSKEGYNMMAGFTETVTNPQSKELLVSSLAGKKPFRQFRNAVETLRIEDDWYDFRDAYLQMIVRDKL